MHKEFCSLLDVHSPGKFITKASDAAEIALPDSNLRAQNNQESERSCVQTNNSICCQIPQSASPHLTPSVLQACIAPGISQHTLRALRVARTEGPAQNTPCSFPVHMEVSPRSCTKHFILSHLPSKLINVCFTFSPHCSFSHCCVLPVQLLSYFLLMHLFKAQARNAKVILFQTYRQSYTSLVSLCCSVFILITLAYKSLGS